ncbi:MAG TPA: FGGY-family carbohydrate kinase [Anaerolineales bacterium]|nr:FGGY-family carbohydrate kinase [Anaerolineales bacterium]
MDCLLAYDVGTTGCKAAVVSPGGNLLHTAQVAYPTHYPQPFWAEQDPQDWWGAIAATTRQVLGESAIPAQTVRGTSFSTTMTNILALDEQGRLLRPCIFWLDGRAGAEAQQVMRRLGGPRLFNLLAGSQVTGKDMIPKLLWLKRNEPDVYRQTKYFVDASGYLLYRMTGRFASEWSVASGLGLFNMKTKTWDKTLFRLFGLDATQFPDLMPSTGCAGGLTPQAADEIGLPPGLPVFAGAGDPMIAAVGSGAVFEGDAYLNLGTSAFIGVLTRRRLNGRRGLVTIQSADPEKLLLFGETSTAGACLDWALRQLYGLEPAPAAFARMDQEVAQVEPGAGGLIFTPWMYGERAPLADENLRAAFINLTVSHTRPQMARAVYEGVAYNLRWILDSIQELYGFDCPTLRVLGGGAQGLPWLRIIADVTGRRLEVLPNPRERLAVGAALVAAVGLGIYPSFEALKPCIPVERVIEPDPAPRPVYERLYPAYQQAYHSLKDLYHQMNG